MILRASKIRPAFFKSEELAACTPEARLCLLGLQMLADLNGRLEDRPHHIRAELFPHDTVDVERLLVELERWGLIRRFKVETQCFISVESIAAVSALKGGRH